jgi:exopolyphosphatase/guanosine-5'-triphosphate,3'-diphosphate pyrophosphatase
VLYLTPLLRLADSLDRSHEQKVRDLQISLKNGTAVLSIGTEDSADLELWAASEAAAAFHEVYAKDMIVQRMKQ